MSSPLQSSALESTPETKPLLINRNNTISYVAGEKDGRKYALVRGSVPSTTPEVAPSTQKTRFERISTDLRALIISFLDVQSRGRLLCTDRSFGNLKEASLRDHNNAVNHLLRKIQGDISQLHPLDQAVLSNIGSSITRLDLSELQITPSILTNLASIFKNVSYINLDRATLSKEHIQALSHFAQLKVLSLNGARVDDNALNHIADLKSLEELILDKTAITGTSFLHLPITLRKLSCQRCGNLADVAIKSLQDKVHLEILNLFFTEITGKYFSTLPLSLKEINCSSCSNLTDEAIEGLNNKVHLEILDLSRTKITGKHFSALPSSLKELRCYSCFTLTDDAIEGLNGKAHLEILILSGTNITGKHFSALPPSLKNLRCWSCSKLTDDAIKNLNNKVHLEILDLSVTKTTGMYFNVLSTSLKNLRCWSCSNLADVAIEGLKDKVHLEKLDLSFTNITGQHFSSLSPALKELNCTGCSKLPAEATTNLKNKMPTLRILS